MLRMQGKKNKFCFQEISKVEPNFGKGRLKCQRTKKMNIAHENTGKRKILPFCIWNEQTWNNAQKDIVFNSLVHKPRERHNAYIAFPWPCKAYLIDRQLKQSLLTPQFARHCDHVLISFNPLRPVFYHGKCLLYPKKEMCPCLRKQYNGKEEIYRGNHFRKPYGRPEIVQ